MEQGKYDLAVEEFFEIIGRVKNIKNVRSDTFFRRCLSIGLNKFSIENRSKILAHILNKEFIINSNIDYLYKIYNNLYEIEKNKYVASLHEYFDLIKFNGFHYTVISFFKKAKLIEDYNYCIDKLR